MFSLPPAPAFVPACRIDPRHFVSGLRPLPPPSQQVFRKHLRHGAQARQFLEHLFQSTVPTFGLGFATSHSLVSSLFLSGAGVALLLQLLLLFWPGMALSWLTRLASSTTTIPRTLSERCTDYCVGCIVTGGSLPLALCLCKKYMGRMDMCHEIACRQADKLFISI